MQGRACIYEIIFIIILLLEISLYIQKYEVNIPYVSIKLENLAKRVNLTKS